MPDSAEISKHIRFPNIWTIGNVFSLLTSVSSLLVMGIGGLLVITRMENDSKQIPSLLLTTKEQSLQIAVLQDQQRNLDSKYGEIMLQLSRLDAKLDKQNEYLFDSLQRINGRQKNSYTPGYYGIPKFSTGFSSAKIGSPASP
jgi:hypothetical protein